LKAEDVRAGELSPQQRLDGARARLADPSDSLVKRARAWFGHRDVERACVELAPGLRGPFAAVLSEDWPGTGEDVDHACVAVAEALVHELAERDASLDLLADAIRFLVGIGHRHFCDALLRRLDRDPAADSWRAMLTSPPADALAWLHSYDGGSHVALALEEAAARAFPRPPDGLLDDLHTHASFNAVGRLHLELVYRLDPRAAAEMICGLPSDDLVRGACRLLVQWGVDEPALIRTLSPPACGLFLAAFAADVDFELQRRAPRAHTPHPMTIADIEEHARYAEEVEGAYAARYADLAQALSERQDDDRMLGPWLAFLAGRRRRVFVTAAHVHPGQEFVPLRSSARVFVERHRAVSFAGTPTTPAVLLARAILLEAAPGDSDVACSIWEDWTALLVSAHPSLRTDDEVTAQVMGWVLAQCSTPDGTWRRTAQRIQPRARSYERSPWGEIDVVASVVVSAGCAAAELERAGEALWRDAFAMAIRHFLVVADRDRDHPSRLLPAWLFHVFTRVFGPDDVELSTLLQRLPTAELVKDARNVMLRGR
jgi:hypothetical protein